MKTTKLVGMVAVCLVMLLAPVNCGKKDNTPPGVTPNLTCTSLCSDNKPSFSWDPATDNGSGVDHYSVCMWGWGLGANQKVWVNVGDATDYALDYALPDGQHTLEVRAVDKAGNEGGSLLCGFICDTSPPGVSSVSAFVWVSDNGTYCRVSWDTNEHGYFQVEYGTTAAYGASQSAPFVNTLLPALGYDVDLIDLATDTTYHYRVKAVDLCGNETVSNDYTFRTL